MSSEKCPYKKESGNREICECPRRRSKVRPYNGKIKYCVENKCKRKIDNIDKNSGEG